MMEVRQLNAQAILSTCSGQTEVSPAATPRFWLLYQQSVLLALKEQGVLDEAQYSFCLEALAQPGRGL